MGRNHASIPLAHHCLRNCKWRCSLSRFQSAYTHTTQTCRILHTTIAYVPVPVSYTYVPVVCTCMNRIAPMTTAPQTTPAESLQKDFDRVMLVHVYIDCTVKPSRPSRKQASPVQARLFGPSKQARMSIEQGKAVYTSS